MPRIKPEIESFARIKVVGVGGSGTNTVDHMIRSKVRAVDFIAVNTDAQDLHHALARRKVFIGRNVTKGLGAGMNPELGMKAAEESHEEVSEVLKGADMVFIACGFGGGTGTGAAPVISNIARETGALTVGVVTRPFSFEGAERARLAEEGLARLASAVDAMIVIPNDRLFEIIDRQTPFLQAFSMCDEVLRQAVEGISDLITIPGIINVDFADVRTIMQNAGSALMGIGVATGDRRAVEAAERAVKSPLLDMSIEGARGVLFSIAGGPDLTMWEINEAARIITGPVAKEAKVIFGALHDDKLKKGEMKVTVIATGFGKERTEAPSGPSLFSERQAVSSVNPVVRRPAIVVQESVVEDSRNEGEWEAVPAFLRRRGK